MKYSCGALRILRILGVKYLVTRDRVPDPQLIERVKLEAPENWNMYLDNMIALGLLLKPALVRSNDNNIYKLLKQNPAIKEVEGKLQEGQGIDYDEARFETTSLGQQLLKVGSKHG